MRFSFESATVKECCHAEVFDTSEDRHATLVTIVRNAGPSPLIPGRDCYHRRMFNFGKPKTPGDWIVHIAGGIIAIFLVWWMLRMYVL